MTDSTNRVIIERIEPRTWALRVRDTRTDQVHELELRGGGPWKIDLNGKAEVTDSGKPRPQVAAPPDDAITLRIERSGSSTVRVAAVGRGAKAWADAQGTLLGSGWFHDAMGAPVVLLEDRPGLVEEIQAVLPEVSLDPSKYLAEPSPNLTERGVSPGIAVPAANTAAPASPKQSRRGFGGKVKVPPDTNIQLGLSNVERGDDMVSVVATGRGEDIEAVELAAWVKQRAASLGPWQASDAGQAALVQDRPRLPEELLKDFPDVRLELGMYKRPGITIPDRGAPFVPEDMVFPETSGAVEREDLRVAKVLNETIRRLAEGFIVIPRIRGYGFRAVELRTDRPTGVFDGLPIGTLLLHVTLRHDADPTILAKDWEPLKRTLRALKRPTKQLDMLREHVSGVLSSASSAARDGVKEPVQTVEAPAAAAANKPAGTATAASRSSAKSRGRKKAKPEPGDGPGGLSWAPIHDHGVEGLAARWGEGHFKLLQLGGDRYGLFYEHDGGGYETLLCGTLEDGKEAAGERAANARPTLDLKAAQVACATPRRTGRPTNDEITLRVRRSESTRAVLVIQATGDRVHEWVFGHKTVLGREWGRDEDNLPEARIHDSPTIIKDLRKELPGVNIDTSAYKKLKAAASTPELATPVEPTPVEPSQPAPESPAPEASPADDPSGQDAELMRSFTSELETMLDEED